LDNDFDENERFIQTKMAVSYDEMAYTLDSYGYTDKRPDKETALKAIRALGPEMLQYIRGFIWPKIIMTPKISLSFIKAKIDNNKKSPNQRDIFFNEPPSSNLWSPKPDSFMVTIVDGALIMPLLPPEIRKLTHGEMYNYIHEDYKRRGMKMISTREYMMLIQQILPSYRFINNKDNIIMDPMHTTLFNCDHLKEIEMVIYGFWHLGDQKYKFLSDYPQVEEQYCYSRPSVMVMEF